MCLTPVILSYPMANPDKQGTRIQGAFDKGALAKTKGKPRVNPYTRPNMAAKWLEGFDSAEVAGE